MTKPRLYFYATVCAVILIAMVATATQEPLFPFKTDSKEWLQKWLLFSVRCCIAALLMRLRCNPPVTSQSILHSCAHMFTRASVQVVDYYGVAVCLCGIVLATGGYTWAGLAWCAGICIVGSPVACIYIIWRISKGSIALQGNDSDFFTPG